MASFLIASARFSSRVGSCKSFPSAHTVHTPQHSVPLNFSRLSRGCFSTDVYHKGLIHTAFSTTLDINKNTPVIPIFRVLHPDGTIHEDHKCPMEKEEVLETYKFMVRINIWDNMLYSVQRQGRFSFYIQNQGEEAVQAGVGKALKQEDHIFCQYREFGVLLLKGMSVSDILGQLFSNKLDESKGRQMPISYTKKSINLQTICTPLTTQVPHAAGAGYAFKLGKEDRISVAFFGDGAASEGDFHGAMNFSSTLKGNTLFICKNNGYAISTPVRDQYAGDGIAIRGVAYGMNSVRVDGNDIFAVNLATKKAREMILQTNEPVLIEFMTYRLGHHSTSDDSSQYRPSGEMEAWQNEGVNPITRFRRFLDLQGWWSDAEEEELRKDARAFMLGEMKSGEKVQRLSVTAGMFDDVYSHPVPHIEEQRASFAEHMQKHKSEYNLEKYQGL